MNTIIDFDQEISRAGTHSSKYENRFLYLGSQDALPLTVADMDFAAPPAVTAALLERAAHPIYGYSVYPESLYESLMMWLKKRHEWEVQREWIVLTPGIVPALFAAVAAYTEADQGVIIQPPVYQPFFQAVNTHKRQLLENPLRLTQARYYIDFEHLEQCARLAGLLLLCSPHNPVGRVFSTKELNTVLEIAERHKLIVFSDEIHADLLYSGYQHTPLGKLNPERVITAFAPSKTFNIPGMNLSALVIPDKKLRAAIQRVFESLHIGEANPFSTTAFEAAYRHGEDWLNQLLVYIYDSKNFIAKFLQNEIPAIKLIEPEATFLLWLDCRELGLNDMELKHLFVHKAKCGIIPGTVFGSVGSGFVRMNIAAPRRIIALALEQIKAAILEVLE